MCRLPVMGEEGRFYNGMRHFPSCPLISGMRGHILLSSTVATNNFSVHGAVIANLDVFREGCDRDSIGACCTSSARGSCGEIHASNACLAVNHGLDDLEIPLSVGFDADFADIFEVRGTRPERERDAGWNLSSRAIQPCSAMKGWIASCAKQPSRVM